MGCCVRSFYCYGIIWDINSVSNGTTTSIAKVTANASDGAKDYTFENPGLYYVYVYATGPGAEGEVYMRTDTVKVESASAPEGKPLAAFFPTGKEAGNVAAWYSRTTGTDKEIQKTYEFKSENKESVFSLAAEDFVDGILKDAINGEILSVAK